MSGFNPVTISKGSFAFCRASIAVLLWTSIIFKANFLVVVVFLIMLLSAILKVEHAPLIILYKNTIDKIKPSQNIVVDEKGIFVSHVIGAIFAALCVILLYFERGIVSVIVTVLFSLLQTSAAFGFCSALKMYTCMSGGSCCRFGKFAKKARNKNV